MSDHKITKICIVFDVSAHDNGDPSLDDILDPGPCLIPLIFDILLCFCNDKIGIVADMKQTFFANKYSKETSRLPFALFGLKNSTLMKISFCIL